MAISAAERARLREELMKAYALEGQVLDYLLDVYQSDPTWLYKRMQEDIRAERAEKTGAKVKESKPRDEAPVPAPAQ
jgi:DNA-binding Lrp family transcriptional regulator